MAKIMTIALGGALGAVLRYAVSGLSYRMLGSTYPWGTLMVNLSGSLVVGFLWGIFEITTISSPARAFAFIGVLGGFTTFSSYTLETFNLVRAGEFRFALSNMLVSNLLGLALVIAGYFAAKHLMR